MNNNKMNDSKLSYYMFDWDDNLLIMPTILYLEHFVNGEWLKTEISSAKYNIVRKKVIDYYDGKNSKWRFLNNNSTDTYINFKDCGLYGNKIFLQDTIKAIKTNSFGPVWNDFINCIINGRIFLIITARGHEPEIIRNTIKWIIFNYLNDEQLKLMIYNIKTINVDFNNNNDLTNEELIDFYLDSCDFIGITSNWFFDKFKIQKQSFINPSIYKPIAVKYFINKVNKFGNYLDKKITVGFSDDDLETTININEMFKYDLSQQYPIIDFTSYHTTNKGKIKLK